MRLAIFDLDGTLLDSVAVMVETMSAAFRTIGAEVPDERAIRSISGLHVRRALETLMPGANDARVDELIAAYRLHFQSLGGMVRQPLFAGALETLDQIHADPLTLMSVATGKSYRSATVLLEAHGIIDRFVSIETPDHNHSKPDPQMVETALGKAGIEAPFAVMIGDTTHDMHMAKAAGVGAIGVSWGYHAVDELHDAGADIVLTSFEQLQPAIEKLTRRG